MCKAEAMTLNNPVPNASYPRGKQAKSPADRTEIWQRGSSFAGRYSIMTATGISNAFIRGPLTLKALVSVLPGAPHPDSPGHIV